MRYSAKKKIRGRGRRPVGQRQAQKDTATIPELWFSWPNTDGLPELYA
jgi:hypothetical protein